MKTFGNKMKSWHGNNHRDCYCFKDTRLKITHASKFFRKLNHPFIVKFYGAVLIREEDRLKVTLLMELCKENLMGRIFQNRDNTPSLSLTPGAERGVI